MQPCPRCGADLIVSLPVGPTTWLERCSACNHEGGGTASFVVAASRQVENDDWPIFTVSVVDPGPRRVRMFQLHRAVLQVSPEQAKALLATPRVDVDRGSRMEVERTIEKFQAAGAMLDITT